MTDERWTKIHSTVEHLIFELGITGDVARDLVDRVADDVANAVERITGECDDAVTLGILEDDIDILRD
jgi:hypothetical protein